MFLLGKKTKPRSIRYPFGGTPPPVITEARLDELVIKLKAGDKSVIDEIVSGHLRLAIAIAGAYATLQPRKAKDLVGETTLALVTTCHEIDKMKRGTFSKYVTYRMHRACSDFLLNDKLIPMSFHGKYKNKQKDKKIMTNKEIVSQTVNPLTKMILDEKIQMAVKTEDERKVFEMKVAGYSFQEIEEETGISRPTACRIFETIQNRFLRGAQNEEA